MNMKMKTMLVLAMAILLMLSTTVAEAIGVSASQEKTADETVLRLAREAIRARLGDVAIPLDDPQAYAVEAVYAQHRDGWRIIFTPRTLMYGLCIAWVEDGEAKAQRADAPGYTGDTVFDRFVSVYGSPAEWDQTIWTQLEAMLDTLETTAFDAQLLQQTDYADDAAAKVSRKEAFAIALEDYAQEGARTYTGVLIDTAQGPVWKLRVMGDPACMLYEIDGMTGAILDREAYKADNYDFDPPVKMYTLRRDYEPALTDLYGRAYVAAVAVSKAYGDMRLDDPMLPLLDGEAYAVMEEADCVRFIALAEGLDSFVARFDSHAMISGVGIL